MAFPSTVDAIVDQAIGVPGTVLHASQVLGPQRLTVGPIWFNVKSDQYGAVGDGVTDDSAAIQAAINACNAAGGGTVYWPPGTYVFSNVTFYRKIRYLGSGIENTILQLRTGSGTGVSLFQSNNFASLTGSNGTGGEFNFSFEQMTLDGNKANVASTVPLFRMYGYGFELRSMRIRNANNEGLYSEWSTSLPTPGIDSMMAFLQNIKVHDCGSHGVHWNGPHDSQWALGEVFLNAARGIFIDTNGSGLILIGVHSWGLTQTYAGYFGTSACGALGCTFEGASTAQLGLDGNDCWTSGGFVYGAGATTPKGIVLGVTGSRQDLSIVGTKINNCTSGALDLTNDAGALIAADIFQSGGTLLVGTPNISTRMTLRTNGVTASVDRLNGGLEIHGGNTLKIWNTGDGTFATISFDGGKIINTWPIAMAPQTPAFAASFTPNLAASTVVAMAALTNNITVNNPSGLVAGVLYTFVWLQDGTGTRTITYGTNYHTSTFSATVTTANTRTIDTFVSDDGVNLRGISRQTGQT